MIEENNGGTGGFPIATPTGQARAAFVEAYGEPGTLFTEFEWADKFTLFLFGYMTRHWEPEPELVLVTADPATVDMGKIKKSYSASIAPAVNVSP